MLNAMRLFGGRLFIDAELLHKEVIDRLVAALERTSALLACLGKHDRRIRLSCQIPMLCEDSDGTMPLGFETPSERATSTL